MPVPGSVPLLCRSHYSFLEGASHPEELVQAAADLALPALALTDRDGVYGIVEAHAKARELGVKLLIGAEVTIDDGGTIALLSQDREGYRQLCRLITKGRLRSKKGQSVVSWGEVAAHAKGLLGFLGGPTSPLLRPVEPTAALGALQDAFGDRLYVRLDRHRQESEHRAEAALRERAKRRGLATVAGGEVLYHHRSRRPLQDVLTCIRHGRSLHDIGRLTRPNAEHDLRPAEARAALFGDDEASERRTLEVAARCTFSLSEIRYRYPAERLPDGSDTNEWLRELTYRGARKRYGGEVPDDVRAQLQKELSLIAELDYGGYFLTMWEVVEFCRREGILCQGRGSAANSAVCYCLGITAIDPVRMGLLFERFLSRERAEPPDIDLDISHARREETIRHMYAKYGRDRAAMVANVIRYRAKSAIREVGKALGLPATLLDRLARMSSSYGGLDEASIRDAGLDPELPIHTHLLRLVNEIQDVPRHLSIHPGGFLLGHEPVCDLVPIENGSMEGRTVIQWDKDDIEELGLFKVDLLGLGALTQLDHAFRLLKEHRDVDLDMASIPPDDPETFEMIRSGDTVGVFQIESRAQMAMLPRLKPRNFYDLVVEVSIVRPGPITGGMVHPYLRRRDGLEPVVYPHPCLQPVLEKTLGVPLFQEQVMRLAVVAADYTPGEADQLRRDMAAWRKSGRIDQHREKLIHRMEKKGIATEFAERVFEQIRGFGEYGFPESHAASFALIAYATSFLRRHFLPEFTASLLNAQPMGFYSISTIVEDAKRHGLEVRPVCVLNSARACTLEVREGAAARPRLDRGRLALRMGLGFIKGVPQNDLDALFVAREKGGAFASVEDLVRRVALRESTLRRLAEVGALEGLERDRRAALWKIRGPERERWADLPVAGASETPAFPALSGFETILWDHRAASHSPRGHPLSPLRGELSRRGYPDSKQVREMPHGRRLRYAGLIICRQRPGTANGVVFVTLEDEAGFVNLVVWQTVFERYALLMKTASFLGVVGRVQSENGVVHVIADSLFAPEVALAPPELKSHDFH